MIIDIPRFIANESAYWQELEQMLGRLEAEPITKFSLTEIRRFHFLYERSAADLARLAPQAEPQTYRFLENLVVRAYGEVHETRGRQVGFHPIQWFFQTLPQAFRRHVRAFHLALAITIAGSIFGAMAGAIDPEAKEVIVPFSHLHGDPSERVAREESATEDRLGGFKGSFSAELMTNNTRVSIFALALGITWGTGTSILLFYNGVILGIVALDYVRAGQTEFLLGWLLPHGVIEIPAILIAGQAGFVLAGAIIGRRSRISLAARLRAAGPDLVTLIFGVAIMLVWAGLVEAFLSQYHAPVFPYWAKISLGVVEFALLVFFLTKSGISREKS